MRQSRLISGRYECARKIFDGRGLYLLVMPNGGRSWRYNYRFDGKLKTLALGVHPDVSLDKARARHQVARTLLADGVDLAARKPVLGNRVFAIPTGDAVDSALGGNRPYLGARVGWLAHGAALCQMWHSYARSGIVFR